ncbi:Flp pilus assembly complex ATPase component TadA [Patescibacteria group bacterium]|nr:Flp pilus assembly complex ATPase component TadA [Patescibacteria group bacterium]
MSLVQQLLKKGVIDKEKATSLEFEVKSSGKKEEEVILDEKIVNEKFLFDLKSENLKIPLKEIDVEEIPLAVLELIPEESARYYMMIPLARTDNFLEVGMVYPEDLASQEALKFLARQSKFSYKVFLITLTTLEKLWRKYRTLKGEVTKALEELKTELEVEKITGEPMKLAELERVVEEAPITKIVAVMIKHAVDEKASDIHIEPLREKSRIRFRVDGILHSSLFLPLRIHPSVVARVKILSDMRLDEMRVPQDGRFSTKIGGKNIDFRVSTYPTTLGEKVAIRILDPSEGLKDVEKLGLVGRNLKVVQEALTKTYGLIFITGPTGCGKTTTLYAMLSKLNKEAVNILTIEDPVEYFLEGVNQSQIRPDIGYDFASGMRHMVRQDPDIIMVGEVRDPDTAALAIHATLTGHVVLSTLHTTNAIGVIPRLIEMGVAPYLIPPTINIALAQRLVRLLCVECKKKVSPRKEIKDMIFKEIDSLPPVSKKNISIPKPFVIYEAKGCKKCNNQGFSGRIGIFEVLNMTDELADIVIKELSEAKIRVEAHRQGMISMKQDGIFKVLNGITSIEEILRVAEEK